jgi:tetratricopeptide (TPR) repeat protein
MLPFIDDFDRGILALSEQRFEEAEERLGRVISLHPENLIARMNLGKALTRLGRLEEARAQYEEATLLAPKSATCTHLLGQSLQALGRYDEAITTFEKIVDDPTHGSDAQQGIGMTLVLMGRPEEGLLTLRRLADRVGGESNTFSALAERVGLYIEARDAVTARPKDERLRLRLAELAIDLRLLGQADRALAFRGSTPAMEALRERAAGSVAGARGDTAAARRAFESALVELKQDVYIRSHLIGIYLDANELDRSLELAEDLIRSGRADAVVYYNKACALARLGRTDEALDDLQRAVHRGYEDVVQINRDPDLAPVRRSPRFPELLETIADMTN